MTNLSYDFERHMTNITTTDVITHDEHEYDGDGRRMRSRLNNSMTWRNFVHDELTDEILAEYEVSGGVPSLKAVFTWGIGLISTKFLTAKRWHHFDGLGNTIALTDSDETVTDRYKWSAFGELEAVTGNSTNPFRYVGQWGYYDDSARGSQFGLLLLGVRYYSPKWGRFMAWDSVQLVNRYSYALNCPSLLVDPTGRFPWWYCYLFCAGAGPLYVECVEACTAASDIHELGKIAEKVLRRKANIREPQSNYDCWGAPATGNQFRRHCDACCDALHGDPSSQEQQWCTCVCEMISMGNRVPKTQPGSGPCSGIAIPVRMGT